MFRETEKTIEKLEVKLHTNQMELENMKINLSDDKKLIMERRIQILRIQLDKLKK